MVPGTSPLIACVGDLMIDVRVAAPALARGGDVPGAVTLAPGGSAANVAVWAREAGGRARVVTRRGDDLAAGLLATALAERGVELRATTAAAKTGAMLVVWEAGERSFVADPGANQELRTGDVVVGLEGADAVYVSGYALVRPRSRRAAAIAAELGGAVRAAAVDAASWSLLTGSGAHTVLTAAAAAGTLLANTDEAAALTGIEEPWGAARRLAERVGVVVVKRGAEGVFVATGGQRHAIAAHHADAVDATGAGDAFAAGYLVARARDADPVEAARAGIVHAARAVATEGAWPPQPAGGSGSK